MRKSGGWRLTRGLDRGQHERRIAGSKGLVETNRHISKEGPSNPSSVLTYNLKLITYNCSMLIVLLCFAILGGCGYHVVGRNSALPKSIHVIAVPAIENKTSVYRIEQRLTSATVHEFLVKTPYRVVPDPENADAVLRGKVLSLEAVPLTFDTATGRATNMLVTVKCEVTFEERETGKVLYHTDNFLFRNQYEIPTVLVPGTATVNPNSVAGFFQEQDPALDRLAQDFAARLVAAVTENY